MFTALHSDSALQLILKLPIRSTYGFFLQFFFPFLPLKELNRNQHRQLQCFAALLTRWGSRKSKKKKNYLQKNPNLSNYRHQNLREFAREFAMLRKTQTPHCFSIFLVFLVVALHEHRIERRGLSKGENSFLFRSSCFLFLLKFHSRDRAFLANHAHTSKMQVAPSTHDTLCPFS
jgi:hypothetical protein